VRTVTFTDEPSSHPFTYINNCFGSSRYSRLRCDQCHIPDESKPFWHNSWHRRLDWRIVVPEANPPIDLTWGHVTVYCSKYSGMGHKLSHVRAAREQGTKGIGTKGIWTNSRTN